MSTTTTVSREFMNWPTYNQGATLSGLEPSQFEVPVWKAAFAIREAVYKCPNGLTTAEWHEWVMGMTKICVSVNIGKLSFREIDYNDLFTGGG